MPVRRVRRRGRSRPGWHVTPLTTVDQTRKQCRLQFVDTPARLVGPAGAGVDAFDRGAGPLRRWRWSASRPAARGARCEMAADYAKTRFQFGRAIGSFQAVKHMCADMLLEAESAVSAARHVAGGVRPAAPGRDRGSRCWHRRTARTPSCTSRPPTSRCTAASDSPGSTPRTCICAGPAATPSCWASPSWHRERYLQRDRSLTVAGGRLTTMLRTRFGSGWRPTGIPGIDRAEWARPVVDGRMGRPELGTAVVRPRPERRPIPLGGSRIRCGRGTGHPAMTATNLFACTRARPRDRRAEATPAARRRCAARASGACSTASPAPARIWPGCAPAPSATVTTGWSTGRRCGRRSRQTADYGMLVARTDWDVPKHHGLTFFMLPMRQPGVEVRPIHQITGESEFNEVFLDRRQGRRRNRIGELDAGLGSAADGARLTSGASWVTGPHRRTSARRRREAQRRCVELAREVGPPRRPATFASRSRASRRWPAVNRWNTQRAKTAADRAEAATLLALGKIAMSRILHETARGADRDRRCRVDARAARTIRSATP